MKIAHLLWEGELNGTAEIPDEVYADQKLWDDRAFEGAVDGQTVLLRLEPELYDLYGSGTGEPVVSIAE